SALTYTGLYYSCSAPPRSLRSFPTRRSSDLEQLLFRKAALFEEAVECGSRDRGRLLIGRQSQFAQQSRAGAMRVLANWLCLPIRDRKSTRLNSSHVKISYAVFCLKKKIAQYY